MCSDVGVEPALQPLDGEPLQFATANSEDGSRLDVAARDFWGRNRQRAFFDVRVFNPFACSYFRSQLSRCYQLHEREKRRAYDERVREVERACFSPLVFAAILVAWGPLLQQFLGSLLQCWLKCAALQQMLILVAM